MRSSTLYSALGVGLLCVGLFGSPAQSHAEVQPTQVAILANADSPDSLAIARHYAAQRHVPPSHIIRLSLPQREYLTREEYDQLVVAPLRRALETAGLASTIRVLVTTYGVPLRLDAPVLSKDEEVWLAEAQSCVKASRQRLEQLHSEFERVAGHPAKSDSSDVPAQNILEMARTTALLSRVDRAWRTAVEQAQKLPASESERTMQTLLSLTHQYGGWGILLQKKQNAGEAGTSTDTPVMAAWRTLLEQTGPLWAGLSHSPITTQRQLMYRWTEHLFGARGVLELASNEVDLLTYSYADASLDSELALLWWDRDLYPVAWRWENPLFQDLAQNQDGLPVLMVSRLDAPTADLAKGLVDLAMQAEQEGLHGTVYLDARGLTPKNPADTYGHYDQSLRDAAEVVKHQSAYPVLLDNQEATLSKPGSAPDVALYVGWYKLRAYEDAFTFKPGAIGYHMASAEAITVHDRRERGWCKNALERGITATLGSVGEPYLDAFPEPAKFLTLLLTGKYSLAEVYYLTSRYVSWRMVLFGDPLYNPMRGRSRPTADSPTPLPISPSDRSLGDPPARLAQKHREQKEQMAMLTRLLLDAEARSAKSAR